ncbi:MAG: hypothetical protein AAF655_19815 [Bacteroidota bacterium]
MRQRENHIANHFFSLVKHLSLSIKLDLIDRISDSLNREDKQLSNDSWRKLFGAWQSEDSADEIVRMVRDSRHTPV